MVNKLKEIYSKTGFTVLLVVTGLAVHGANDLRKNLHYGVIDRAVAAELAPLELPEQIDSEEFIVPPAYPNTKLDKVKSSTHKLLGKE